MSKSVLITSGESSGELYGAMLAKELFSRWQGLQVFGIGGRRMREAGVDVFAGYSSAIGLIEALAVYREVKRTYEKTVEVMERERPDVVVLIDYPDFNFRVGAKARELGAKVLYYVSPQILSLIHI
ncbi:MAG TPA: lipid-A-disaccharide synthase, partial [Nitrospirae bacterium]|nr:lipid-A-disaccharide synthase [Nitrospirota bacterium]